ncbi:hypothetical protein KKB40_00040 [Patescibacteria group bacterium]|nr:hypothetical protein [Patescibacteria group bacterium]
MPNARKSNMYSEILSKIKTAEDAEKMIEEIDILLNSMYFVKDDTFDKQDPRKVAEQSFDLILKSKIRAWTAQILINEFSKEGVNKTVFLQELKNKLESYKIFKLDIAFEPTRDFIEKIYDFVSKNISDEILLEINYVPGLIGGAVMVFNGKYRDFSLKKVFDEEFEKNRGEVLKLLFE